MKRIIFLIQLTLVCNLCFVSTSSKCIAQTEKITGNQSKLITFTNERGDISIRYPEGWFVREHRYINPYKIFLSREKVEKPPDMFQVGMTIAKWYHQSWYLGLDKNDINKSLIYFMDAGNTIPFPDKKIGEKKNIVINGVPGLMREFSFGAPAGHRVKLYQVYAMKDDALVGITYEAPETEFENYRKIFEESLNRAKIFSSDSKVSDNTLLDRETDWFVIKKTEGKGNLDEILSVFKDAESMNPSYATTSLTRGHFLMHCAENKGFDSEAQKMLLKEAERDLKLAIELYNKYSQDYEDYYRKFNISQCYFLLGDIYYFPYDKKDEAKIFYKKSLEDFDLPMAEEALKERYKQ